MSEKTYKDGKKDGLELLWFEGGQQLSEKRFKDGQLDGETIWYENGEKRSEMNSEINMDAPSESEDLPLDKDE